MRRCRSAVTSKLTTMAALGSTPGSPAQALQEKPADPQAGFVAAVNGPENRPLLQRETIVAAARELVSTSGLEALSLRRLASTLGVTAPALYAHVTDKNDLLRAVAEGEFDELAARFEAVHVEDPIALIRAHGRAYLDYARENPALFRVMFLFPPNLRDGTEVAPDIELPAATRVFAMATQAITDAIDAGVLVVEDPLLTALTLWAGMHGVAQILLLGFTMTREFEDALIAEVTDRLLAGYRP